MDWDDMLLWLTLGSVAPYATVAASECIKRTIKRSFGANAPQ